MEELTTKITVPGKDLIQIRQRKQKLYKQAKIKRIQQQRPALQQMVKELLQVGNTREEKDLQKQLRKWSKKHTYR